jgi:hypothetical protein
LPARRSGAGLGRLLAAVIGLASIGSALVLASVVLAGTRSPPARETRVGTSAVEAGRSGVEDASSGAGDADHSALRLAAQVPRRPRSSFRGMRPFGDVPRGYPPLALPLMPTDGPLDLRPSLQRRSGAPFEFYFTRAAYSGYGTQGFASWSVDYPKADQQFMIGVRRLLGHLDAYTHENPILLTDPELLRYPFLYAVEAGHMALTEEEVLGLRRYLEAGGFLLLDDFWGSIEWENLELELERVLPGRPWVEIDPDHPVFHCFYDVEKVVQVPNVGLGRAGGHTHEQDGYFPSVRGVLDEDGRLMVAMHWNSDMGDAWEWAEDAYYPLEFSTFAYQMGVNYIVYAMTH